MSNRTAAELSVVIVSFNSRQHLAACLQSLYAQSCPPHMEIFVVDNASQDGGAGLVAGRFPGVTLIRNRQNVGFARACNQAIRRSSGQYVLLLNPDTVVHDGALEAMVRFADQNAQIGALGPMILDQAGKVDYRCARRLPTLFTEFLRLTRLSKRFPHHRILGWAHFGDWDHRSSRAAPCLVGACMLVRRAAIEQVGLLDEDFFLYGEDIEWCARIARSGWEVYYFVGATVTHLGGASSTENKEALGLVCLHSQALEFRKRRGRTVEHAFRALVVLVAMGKLVLATGGFPVGSVAARLVARTGANASTPTQLGSGDRPFTAPALPSGTEPVLGRSEGKEW
jgi:N-acetylglucosaminyl-diphospho-decaprenol L-rhamnosyltransferase